MKKIDGTGTSLSVNAKERNNFYAYTKTILGAMEFMTYKFEQIDHTLRCHFLFLSQRNCRFRVFVEFVRH